MLFPLQLTRDATVTDEPSRKGVTSYVSWCDSLVQHAQTVLRLICRVSYQDCANVSSFWFAGPVVGNYAMELAITKAKDTGIGWVATRGMLIISITVDFTPIQ